MTAAIFIPAFIIIELRKKEPLVDLRLFAQELRAWQHRQCGPWNWSLWRRVYPALIPRGRCTVTTRPRSERSSSGWVFQFLVIPLIPKLMQLVDTRIIIGMGIIFFGGSSFLTTHLDSNFAGPQFYIPLIIRALGQPLIMVPLSAVTTSGMTKGRESGAASALFNMMRNIRRIDRDRPDCPHCSL